MRLFHLLIAGLLLLQPFTQLAMAAKVEGLQLPVWVQRGDVRTALKPGSALLPGDQVQTGDQGRLVMRMDDDSLVKLGVNAQFKIEQLNTAQSTDSLFTGTWKLLTGAFRFSTTALGAARQRSIDISVGTATIGIRGTDVWGRASEAEDLVCLIEGQIEITRQGEAAVTMVEPLSVYTAPRGGPANPLTTIEVPLLQKLGAETELEEGRGVLRAAGEYSVYLLSTQQQAYADEMREHYQTAGYPAEVTEHEIDDKNWYRVGIAHFISLQDARAFAEQIEGVLGTKGAWVKREQ